MQLNTLSRVPMVTVALSCSLMIASCELGSSTPAPQPVSDSVGRTFGGDFLVRSNSDLGKLSGYAVVEGDILIEPWTELIEVDLPKLKLVHGSILIRSVYDKDVFVVHAKQLLKVGLNIQVAGTTSQVNLEFPKLNYIGGHLEAMDAQISISAARLITINGDIRAKEVTWKGKGLALPSLETVNGSIRLTDYSADYEDAADFQTDLRFPELLEITGNFQIRSGSETFLDMPKLYQIGGDIEISNVVINFELPKLGVLLGHARFREARLRGFDLSALHTVHGLLEFFNCQLEGGTVMDFSGLRGIPNTGGMTISAMGGVQEIRFGDSFDADISNLIISSNANLGVIDLGGMTHIHSKLHIVGNGPIEIHAPELLEVGNLVISGNAHTKAYFNKLEHLYGSLTIADTMLHALVMNNLEEVGGSVRLSGLYVTTQDYLLTGLRWILNDLYVGHVRDLPILSFGALEKIGTFWQGTSTGDLTIEHNGETQTLALPALASVARHCIIRYNYRLDPQSVNLSMQAVQCGGDRVICENGEFGEPPCP